MLAYWPLCKLQSSKAFKSDCCVTVNFGLPDHCVQTDEILSHYSKDTMASK